MSMAAAGKTYTSDVASGRHFLVACVLAIAGTGSTLLLMPYLFAAMPQLVARIPVPLWLFVASAALQSGALILLLGWLGLRLGYRYDLGAPWLRRWLRAEPSRNPRQYLLVSILIGLVIGSIILLVVLLDTSLPVIKNLIVPEQTNTSNWWQGLLASFYGGIAEEILLRQFAVSLLVWIAAHLLKQDQPESIIYWFAIVAAAVLFGIGHLPAAAQIIPLNFAAATHIIGLNTIGGVAFGAVFWRWGLEHAMLTHFTADLVLHVVAPLIV